MAFAGQCGATRTPGSEGGIVESRRRATQRGSLRPRRAMRQASSPTTRYAWPYANLVSRAGLATYAINVPSPALPPSRAAFKLVNRRHRLVVLSREGAMLGERKGESRTDPLTRSSNSHVVSMRSHTNSKNAYSTTYRIWQAHATIFPLKLLTRTWWLTV